MKTQHGKITVILLSLILFASDAFSQSEITPYTGIMFGGRGYGYYVDVSIDDGQNWGIMGDFTLMPGLQVELLYNRMVSRAQVWDYRDKEQEIFDLASEYFMIGGLKSMNYGRIEPFGVFMLGVAAHTPQKTTYSNKVSFAMTLGGGLKLFITENVGIRLQGRFMAPLYLSGIGLGCGIGTGGASCGGGVGLSSTLLQGDFSAGIILRMPGTQ